MIKRRAFLGSALTTATLGAANAKFTMAQAQSAAPPSPEPLVWPIVTKLQPGIRSLATQTPSLT
jgi:hypothetical protein